MKAQWHDGDTDTKSEPWDFIFPHDVKHVEQYIDMNWHMSLTITKPCGCMIRINAQTRHLMPCNICDSALTQEEANAFNHMNKPWDIELPYKRKETQL